VVSFESERGSVTLEDGSTIRYRGMVVAPRIPLDWATIDGLSVALGRNAAKAALTLSRSAGWICKRQVLERNIYVLRHSPKAIGKPVHIEFVRINIPRPERHSSRGDA
jgi:hypothetical protein